MCGNARYFENQIIIDASNAVEAQLDQFEKTDDSVNDILESCSDAVYAYMTNTGRTN